MKLGSQGGLAFPSQIARTEGKEEGSKDRNQAMLKMNGKGKVKKTLKRDGKDATTTEGHNVSSFPEHGQLSHVQPIRKRTENRPRATEAKEGQEGKSNSVQVQA